MKPLLRSKFSPDSCDFVPAPPVIGGKLVFSMSRGTAIILSGNQTGHLKAWRLFCIEANRSKFRLVFSSFPLNGPVWVVYENKQGFFFLSQNRQFEGPGKLWWSNYIIKYKLQTNKLCCFCVSGSVTQKPSQSQNYLCCVFCFAATLPDADPALI